MFKHGKCISQEIWIKPRKQNKTDAITTQVTRRGKKARNEQKKEKKGVVEGLRNQRIGWGQAGTALLSNDKSRRKKERASLGLKERGIEAGYSITATKRKARAEVDEEGARGGVRVGLPHTPD